jgi:hypothetical protein
VDLIADLKMVFDNLEDKLNRKEDKKKEKKEAPKDEKKEDKEDDSKEDMKPEKKDNKEDMGAPAGIPEEMAELPLPSEQEMPPIMASYKVELIKDAKVPVDSYYIISLNKNPLFSVSARQAFAKDAESELKSFTSDEYKKELTVELNKRGSKDAFKSIYGSLGVVLAQEEKLPENKFEEPAKDMNVAPDALKDITNDDTKKESFSDLILEVAASTIARMKGSTAQEFVDEFRDIFSDETKSKQFEGRLSEKVEQKKKDVDTLHTPDVYTDNMPKMPDVPAEGLEMPKPEDVKAMASKLAEIKKVLPEIKQIIRERDELKAKLASKDEAEKVKVRVTATMKLSEKKAKFGLIDDGDIKQEALRLAKLSDSELEVEVKELENSIKIANKIGKKHDSNKIESNSDGKVILGNINTGVPSPLNSENEVVVSKTFSWSKGISGNR